MKGEQLSNEKFTCCYNFSKRKLEGYKIQNMIKINNKPLIYWTIRDCLKSKKINSVWVSSDNLSILKFA